MTSAPRRHRNRLQQVRQHDARLTTKVALESPRPTPLRCPRCHQVLSPAQTEKIRAALWGRECNYHCDLCEWDGPLFASTIGQLLTMFGETTLTGVADMLDEILQTDNNTFVDFDESTQDYVFGYWDTGVELPLPIDPRELMTCIGEFEDMYLAQCAAEEAAEAEDRR